MANFNNIFRELLLQSNEKKKTTQISSQRFPPKLITLICTRRHCGLIGVIPVPDLRSYRQLFQESSSCSWPPPTTNRRSPIIYGLIYSESRNHQRQIRFHSQSRPRPALVVGRASVKRARSRQIDRRRHKPLIYLSAPPLRLGGWGRGVVTNNTPTQRGHYRSDEDTPGHTFISIQEKRRHPDEVGLSLGLSVMDFFPFFFIFHCFPSFRGRVVSTLTLSPH